jgi:hypothetical protein
MSGRTLAALRRRWLSALAALYCGCAAAILVGRPGAWPLLPSLMAMTFATAVLDTKRLRLLRLADEAQARLKLAAGGADAAQVHVLGTEGECFTCMLGRMAPGAGAVAVRMTCITHRQAVELTIARKPLKPEPPELAS